MLPDSSFSKLDARATWSIAFNSLSAGLIIVAVDIGFHADYIGPVGFVHELLNASGAAIGSRLTMGLLASGFVALSLWLRSTHRRLGVFFNLVEDAGDAVFWKDANGKLLYVNRTACELLSYPRDELLTKTLFDLDPELTPLDLKQSWREIQGNRVIRTVRRYRAKSGELIPIELIARSLRLGSGEYSVSVVRDMRQQKHTEALLKDRQDQLARAQEIAQIGSYSWNLSTHAHSWSEQMFRNLGCVPGEFTPCAESYFQFVHPEDLDALRAQRDSDIQNNRVHISEHRILHRDGTIRWVRCQGELVTKSDGSREMVGTVHDITARKNSELALRGSEERTRLILDSTAEGIMGIDTEGRCTFINPAALALFGFKDAQSIEGTRLHSLIHHSHKDGTPYPEVDCPMFKTLREGIPAHVDHEVYWRTDGSRFDAEYWIHPITNGDIVLGAVYAVIDITERKRAESALFEANRLKDLFTDIMRHDLINPASAIKTSSELVIRMETDPIKTKLIRNIRRSVGQLIELCENASRYAKLSNTDALPFEEQDLGLILRNVIQSVAGQCEQKRIAPQTLVDGPCIASVNPVISEVFLNLISNAIKYSPEGSTISLTIAKENEAWRISVADRGEGIPDSSKEKIFTRFERLERGDIKGTGLGLAIAKQITLLHHGKIWVENNPGGGSIFHVRIPALKPAPKPLLNLQG